MSPGQNSNIAEATFDIHRPFMPLDNLWGPLGRHTTITIIIEEPTKGPPFCKLVLIGLLGPLSKGSLLRERIEMGTYNQFR